MPKVHTNNELLSGGDVTQDLPLEADTVVPTVDSTLVVLHPS